MRHKLQGDGSTIVLREYLEYYHLEAEFLGFLFYSKDSNLSQVV